MVDHTGEMRKKRPQTELAFRHGRYTWPRLECPWYLATQRMQFSSVCHRPTRILNTSAAV